MSEQGFENIEERLTSVEAKVDRLEGKVDNLESKVDGLRVEVQGLYGLYGGLRTEMHTFHEVLGRQMRVLHEEVLDRIATLSPDYT